MAVTDAAWYEHLSRMAPNRRLDEVNFWPPRALWPIKQFRPGEPVFFRLKEPRDVIVGYGYFTHFSTLEADEAWRLFGERNGSPDEASFARRVRGRLGCTLLRDVHLWPPELWIPWGRGRVGESHTKWGASVRDSGDARVLMAQTVQDSRYLAVRAEWEPAFRLAVLNGHRVPGARETRPEGQGTFQTRVRDAYDRQCAITGEKAWTLLEATHIQPYAGPASNHVQNGLLLSKDFQSLYQAGFVTVTPDHEVRVSAALRDRWGDVRRYRRYDGRSLAALPWSERDWPSPEALAWHGEHVFAGST